MKNLAKAILGVMNDVKGIDKSMTIGTGTMSYKGIADKDVKKIVGDAMQKHELCILPIDVVSTLKIDRFEEQDYQGKLKSKQSVFTEVKTEYMLMHSSGESMKVVGYGQGIDSQDKGAGKATTYALKYLLLYLFMIPTGTIDDADNTHSDEIKTPPIPIKKENLPLIPPLPTKQDMEKNEKTIKDCTTMELLSFEWQGLHPSEKKRLESLKEEMKLKLTKK